MMDTFKLATVAGSSIGGVEVTTTDSQDLNWILSELKKLMPHSRVKTEKLLSQDNYWAKVDQLSGKDDQVKWWVLQQLCARSWEPFAATKIEGYPVVYMLRRKG